MSALKMMALRWRSAASEAHDVERADRGEGHHQHRGDDGEVFGDVVGDAEGGERTARHEELFADLDDLDELGGIAVEIDHVAGLAGGLGAGVHGDADIGLGRARERRWCRLRSWRRGGPAACSARMRRSLSSGVAWAMKSSTPASAAMAAAVMGLSPVIMTVRMPILRSWAKRSLMPPLTTSLSSTIPSTFRLRDDERCASGARGGLDGLGDFGGIGAAEGFDVRLDRIGRALADAAAFDVDAAHAGLGGEGNEGGVRMRQFAAADVELLFGEHHDAAAFGSFIGERGELRGIGELLLGDAGRGTEIGPCGCRW
jgi:hypothetical protein